MSGEYKTHEFKIQGIDCLDCASSIEKAVVKIKGVKSAKLNFETAKLSVEIEAGLDTQKIILAIKGLGYGNSESGNFLSQIPDLVKAYSCFETDLGKRDETSFKYLLHNPQDSDRKLVMTVMAFNIPEK